MVVARPLLTAAVATAIVFLLPCRRLSMVAFAAAQSMEIQVMMRSIDHASLASDGLLLAAFTDTVAECLAGELSQMLAPGVVTAEILESHQNDSINANASITPSSNVSFEEVREALYTSATAFATNLTLSVMLLPGIGVAVQGDTLVVEAITAPQLNPRPNTASDTACSVPMYVRGSPRPCLEGVRAVASFTVCTAHCGYGLSASRPALLCAWGSLVPPAFECQPSDCRVHTLPFAASPACAEGMELPHGGSCMLRCLEGYGVAQEDQIICKYGALTPVAPGCQPLGCPSLAPRVDGSLQPCLERTNTSHASVCTPHCAAPQIAVPELMVCLFGRFIPSTFSCSGISSVHACDTSTFAHNASCFQGRIIPDGGLCTLRCLEGFRAMPATLICTNASFGLIGPSCEAPCLLSDGDCAEGSSIASRTNCTRVCAAGLAALPPALSCQDGSLSPPSSTCLLVDSSSNNCSAPTGIANTAQTACSEASIASGSSCHARCADGFQPTLSNLICVNGLLSPPSFACVRQPCDVQNISGMPTLPACHGLAVGEPLGSGLVCRALCGAGFVPLPDMLTCTAGRLEPPSFSCFPWPGDTTALGPEIHDQICYFREACILSGLQGIGLREDDKLMLLSACGAHGTEEGFPEGPFQTSRCATVFDLGQLPLGSTRLCWCPGGAGCGVDPALYSKDIGSLLVRCPAGQLASGSGGCARSSCDAPAGIASAASPACSQGSLIDNGTSCTARCLQGLGLAPSEPTLLCLFGQLQPQRFTCSVATGSNCTVQLLNPAAFCQEGQPIAHNGVCTATCATGYEPWPTSLSCSDGQLVPGEFSCSPAHCALPPQPQVGNYAGSPCEGFEASEMTITSGTVCTTRCQEGYLPNHATLYCSFGRLEPTATFQCLDWMNQSLIDEEGFGPTGNRSLDCSVGSDCTLRSLNLAGSKGLSDGDQVLLLKRCGKDGERLGAAGYPNNPRATTACGTEVSFGIFGLEAPVGSVAICYCPKQAGCGGNSGNPDRFWKEVGTLTLSCPMPKFSGDTRYYKDPATQRCLPCNASSGPECGVCRLRNVSYNGQDICSCHRGEYDAGGVCRVCGQGYYCEGPPNAVRKPCRPNSLTVRNDSQSADECECAPGHWQQLNGSTAHCVGCQRGYYKSVPGNGRCGERCMQPGGTSDEGATGRGACYCDKGYYFSDAEQSCKLCASNGVDCLGGLQPATGEHRGPMAKPGYYMVDTNKFEKCTHEIEYSKGNKSSVCRGGSLVEAEKSCPKKANITLYPDGPQGADVPYMAQSCVEGHTDVTCGTCAAGYTRATPEEQCKPCSRMHGVWQMLLGINLELLVRAVLGLFIAQRALTSAAKPSQYDAIILRVWIQWMAASGIVVLLDFSGVEVFSWSKEAQKDVNATLMAQWPTWWKAAWNWLYAVNLIFQGSLAGSSQERLECLVEGGPDFLGASSKLVFPTLFWTLYPCFVTVWLVILSVFLAKVAHPILVECSRRCHKCRCFIDLFCGQAEDTQQDGEVVEGAQSSKSSKSSNSSNSSSSAENIEDSEAETNEYKVFGLFAGTSFCEIFRGLVPIVNITIYSNWDFVTQVLFFGVQTRTVSVSGGARESRWTTNMQLCGYFGEHLPVALISNAGLLIWSIGFLLLLMGRIRKQEGHLHELENLRAFGYFYGGLRTKFWWWELLVKRMELLLLYFVAYSQVFPDLKAKLIAFTSIAGVSWTLHSAFHPFDERSNCLVDRLETRGLCTRFASLLLLQTVIVLNADISITALVAAFLLALNGFHILTMFFSFLNEIGMLREEKLGEASDGLEVPGARVSSAGQVDASQAFMQFCMGGMLKITPRRLLNLPLWPLKWLFRQRTVVAERVPHLIWNGVGGAGHILEYRGGVALRDIETKRYLIPNKYGEVTIVSSLVTHVGPLFEFRKREDDGEGGCTSGTLATVSKTLHVDCLPTVNGTLRVQLENGRICDMVEPQYRCDMGTPVRWLLTLHYGVTVSEQRQYIAQNISAFVGFLLVEANVQVVPDHLLDVMCLLPISVRRYEAAHGPLRIYLPVCRQLLLDDIECLVATRLVESDNRASYLTTACTFTHGRRVNRIGLYAESEYMVRPEEIMDTIGLLRSLRQQVLLAFLNDILDVMRGLHNRCSVEQTCRWRLGGHSICEELI